MAYAAPNSFLPAYEEYNKQNQYKEYNKQNQYKEYNKQNQYKGYNKQNQYKGYNKQKSKNTNRNDAGGRVGEEKMFKGKTEKGMSEERRSAKLHKQPEVEADDDSDDETMPQSESSDATITGAAVSGGVPTPTVQSASSSSGTSPDETQQKVPPPMQRKSTLIRTQAVEGTSPPPQSFFSQVKPNGAVQDSHLLSNGGTNEKNGKKKTQSHEAKEFLLASHKVSSDSGHGTMDQDGSSDTSVLSRDSSLENAVGGKDPYKDSSGVNITKFVKETMQKSPKDKKAVVTYEGQILDFIKNDNMQTLKMAEMTSYDRMIIHRLAAYLGLEHNVDSTGKCVILSKTENTRYVKLTEMVLSSDDAEVPARKILQKPSSFDEKANRSKDKSQFSGHRTKSLEERKQNYAEARERIFKGDEIQPEGATAAPLPPAKNLLTANYNPQLMQQRSLDSARPNSQHRWAADPSFGMDQAAKRRANMTKSNSYGGSVASSSHPSSESPITHYSNPPNLQQSSQLPQFPTPATTPSDHSHMSCSTPEGGQHSSQQCPPPFAYLVSSDYSSIPVGSLIINPHTMQPHTNADGSFYRFDPQFPPSFMVPPPGHPHAATPPATTMVYPPDSISDMTARLSATSLTPIDQMGEPYQHNVAGHGLPMVSAMMPQVYTSAQPTHLTQAPYFTATSQSPGPQVRYVAFPMPQGQQQILQAAPVESQGQTTVPMPAIGIPAVPGAGGYQVMGPPYQPMPGVDLSAGYAYGALPDNSMSNPSGGVNTQASMVSPGAPQYVQAYSISYSQPQPHPPPHQHSLPHSHQAQFNPGVTTPTGTTYYTAVPASSPTPPLTLTQPPPPSSHHQPQLPQQQQQQQPHQQQPSHQHQPAVYYNPNLGNLTALTYSIPVSNPSSSAPSSFKSISTPLPQNQFRPSTPTQQLHHPHQQPPQTAVVSSSNGHHPPQLTLSYGQPMTFTPGQPVTPIAAPQGSQLVAIQPNPYQVRPIGAVFQIAGGSPVPAQQLMSGPQIQSYQLRSTGQVQDVRVNPGAVRPRMSLPFNNPQGHPRAKVPNQTRHPKKGGGGKKYSGGREGEEYQGPTTPQQMGAVGMMGPLVPNLGGPMSHSNPHLPSASSNRQ